MTDVAECLIHGALLIDGSGAEPRRGDLAVRGDRIMALGNLDGVAATRHIDAEGLCLAPGFIDIHSHSDYYLVINPDASSKLLQGVTTEVGGNCGYAAAPVWGAARQERRDLYREQFGIEAAWDDLASYGRHLERLGIAVNYAPLVGHNTIRASAMGMDDRSPSAAEMAAMRQAVAHAMEGGAFGLSTGFVYAPACFAEAEEFIDLARIVRSHGGIITSHIRSEGDGLIEAIEEILHIARAAAAPLQISHLKTFGPANWRKLDTVFARLEAAQAEGIEVHCDRYPYLAANTGLSAVLPRWALAGGVDEQARRCSESAPRQALMEAVQAEHPDAAYWEKVVISEVTQERNRELEGLSITACAARRGRGPIELVLDLLADERMNVAILLFTMNEANMRRILRKPYVMIGSDAGCRSHLGPLARGKPHPRGFGTFARVLGQLCREEGLFELATAVFKMTGAPARKLGLRRRGLLREGFYADLVLFDAATIADEATYEEPLRYPRGIQAVFVNGTLSVWEGHHLGSRAGRFLRKDGECGPALG